MLAAFSLQTSLDAVALPDNVKKMMQQRSFETEKAYDKNALKNSPWVIPTNAKLNTFDLLLVIGQDEELSNPPIELFTTKGFKDMLGWDDEKITTFRQAAISWFNERFGIDFSNGLYDPNTESITTSFGVMFPYYYQGYLRVLLSNNTKIPPYTRLTPSSVGQAEYLVVFFDTPTYTGTYANGGAAITGNVSDTLAYGCSRIFLNRSNMKTYSIFDRSYYPIAAVPNRESPTRQVDRYQLYSPEFGSGFSCVNSSAESTPNANGKFNTNALATWCFPGTYVNTLADYNEFTEAPVQP